MGGVEWSSFFFFLRFRREDIWLAAGGGCHSLSLCSSHKHSTVLADDYRCNTAPLWIMFRLECRQRSLSRTLMSDFFWSHQYFLWFYNLLHSRKIIDSDRSFIDAPLSSQLPFFHDDNEAMKSSSSTKCGVFLVFFIIMSSNCPYTFSVKSSKYEQYMLLFICLRVCASWSSQHAYQEATRYSVISQWQNCFLCKESWALRSANEWGLMPVRSFKLAMLACWQCLLHCSFHCYMWVIHNA